MFNDDEKKSVGRTTNVVAASLNLAKFSAAEMIAMYEDIRSKLPPISLDKMNVEEELLLQFHTVRALQNQVIADEGTPVNQKAQVANSVSSSLKQIAELQNSVFDSERFKRIELLLIRVLSKLPEDTASAFLDEYERAYKLAHD